MNSSQARCGQLVGERLDVPRAAGRVDDPAEARLVVQDRVRVAGDAAREVVGQPERGVERQHGDRVGAADRRRRSRRSWCAACSPTGRAGSSSPPTSPRAGAATRSLPRRTVRRRAPRSAGRRAASRSTANWSAVTAKRNSSAREGVVDRQSRVGQRAQVGDADRRCDRDLGRVARAGVVVDGGVDRREPQVQVDAQARRVRRARPPRHPCGHASPIGSAPSEPLSCRATPARSSNARAASPTHPRRPGRSARGRGSTPVERRRQVGDGETTRHRAAATARSRRSRGR